MVYSNTMKHLKLLLILALIVGIFYIYFVTSSNSNNFKSACANCNVILVSVDTLGAKHLDLYNEEKNTSPMLKLLADKKGVVFESAFSQAPWTLPSHSSMLTGKYPWQVSMYTPSDKLPENTLTLAESLSQHGYTTGAISNGPFVQPEWGLDQGFDSFEGSMNLEAWNDAPKIFKEGLSWINKQKEANNKPYFLFLHSFHVHDPYGQDEDQLNITDIIKANEEIDSNPDIENFVQQYENEIKEMDAAFSDFMRKLEEQSELDNTLVIFTADHGEEFGEHGSIGYHGSLYNETLHVPLIFFAPDLEADRFSNIIETRSLPATTLSMLKLPEEASFEGKALTGIIDGIDIEPRVAISFNASKNSTLFSVKMISDLYDDIESITEILKPNYRVETYAEDVNITARSDQWRLINNHTGVVELYNETNDKEERENLFSNLIVAQELQKIESALQQILTRIYQP